MHILVDTHVLIWYLDGNNKLSDKLHDLLNDNQHKVFISMVSLWEIAIKINIGKLEMTYNLTQIQAYIRSRNFVLLGVAFEHLNTLLTLPLHHKDPFDRLLIAQAITENLTLISADQHFQAYIVNLIQ